MNETTKIINEALTLKKFSKAKRNTVENFVTSCGDNGSDNWENIKLDAKLYDWNGPTIECIRFCLLKMGKL